MSIAAAATSWSPAEPDYPQLTAENYTRCAGVPFEDHLRGRPELAAHRHRRVARRANFFLADGETARRCTDPRRRAGERPEVQRRLMCAQL